MGPSLLRSHRYSPLCLSLKAIIKETSTMYPKSSGWSLCIEWHKEAPQAHTITTITPFLFQHGPDALWTQHSGRQVTCPLSSTENLAYEFTVHHCSKIVHRKPGTMALVSTWGVGGLTGRHYYKKFPSEIPVKSSQSTAHPSIQSAL